MKGIVKLYPVDFNPIDTDDTLDIHRYLMKEIYYKTNIWIKCCTGLLISITDLSNLRKFVSLSNQ